MSQQCACIKGDYDFDVETKDRKYLRYQDLSDWMQEDGYCDPDTYTLGIKGPKQKDFVSFDVEVGVVNQIDAEDIRGNVPGKHLSDGVYCFRVNNCGVEYLRNKAVIPHLECCLDNYITRSDDLEDWEAIYEIRVYIESIYVNAEHGNRDLAMKHYRLAETLLTKANCDCKELA